MFINDDVKHALFKDSLKLQDEHMRDNELRPLGKSLLLSPSYLVYLGNANSDVAPESKNASVQLTHIDSDEFSAKTEKKKGFSERKLRCKRIKKNNIKKVTEKDIHLKNIKPALESYNKVKSNFSEFHLSSPETLSPTSKIQNF
jgi:hypothetical protein